MSLTFPLLGTLAAFALIIFMASKKIPLYVCVLTGTLIVGLCCGLNPLDIARTIGVSLTDSATVDLLTVIALICVSSFLLQKFSLLKRAVEALDRLLPSSKITIMLVPMLIGCLTVAGGAIISAPMVDQLGERMNLQPRRRAAINLLYRHAGHFMFPFVPGIIMASNLGGFAATELAAMMSPVTIALLLCGYFFLLRDIKVEPNENREYHIIADLGAFLLNASPILLPLVLSIILGYKFSLSLTVGIILAVVLILVRQQGSRNTDSEAAGGTTMQPNSASDEAMPSLKWNDLVRGLYEQRKLLFSAGSIMIFRGMIIATNVLTPFITDLLATGIPLALLSVLLPFLIGYSTGQIASAIGICWPLLIPAGFVGPLVPLAMLMYCSGYLGYFFSPLHLCTVLTNGFFKVEISHSYRDLMPIFIPIPALMAALYFIFR